LTDLAIQLLKVVLAGGSRITLSHLSHKHIGTSPFCYSWSPESFTVQAFEPLPGFQDQVFLHMIRLFLIYYINTKLQLPIHHHFITPHLCHSQAKNFLLFNQVTSIYNGQWNCCNVLDISIVCFIFIGVIWIKSWIRKPLIWGWQLWNRESILSHLFCGYIVIRDCHKHWPTPDCWGSDEKY
jgi:hypothetical protein